MRVEGGVGEAVDLGVVHGDEELAGLDGGGDVNGGLKRAAARFDGDELVAFEAEAFGVVGVNFDVDG